MNDSSENLEKRLKSFYERQTLEPDVLRELKQSVLKPTPKPKPEPEPKPINWFSSWFSNTISLKPIALAFVIFLFFLFGGMVFTIQNTYQQTYFMASEIAINHQKDFNIEFQANEMADLAHAMPKLNFTPIVSTRMDWPDYQILGSRYCTIDNAIATQIRLKDTNNQAYTLYQFRPPDSVAPPDETTLVIDDVTVKIWYEEGLIMGLAQTNTSRKDQ